MKKDLRSVVDFLFEVGMLAKTPRSFTYFLGSGEQSVAEHINRCMYVGFVLATLDGNVDIEKVIVKVASDNWWFSNKEDQWWVSRNEQSSSALQSKKVLKKHF